MNLVKWFRKNNTKLMAVVVIVLMVGFVGGSSLSYFLRYSGGANKTIAYYGNKNKIKRDDLIQAQNELNVLKMLEAGNILKGLQVPLFQSPDFHSLILGELLFSEQRASQEVITYIQQTAGQNQFRISNEQINDMYRRNVLNFYYWFLLKTEAEKAGFKVPNEAARQLLTDAISGMFGQSYSQYTSALIQRNSISEQQILSIFGKLIAILRYSHATCTTEDITIRQLRHMMTWEEEGIDVEFVEFDSEDFAETQETPTEEQIIEHFEKHKRFVTNEVNDENPYGFGYKLPARVQLEYIALRLDDIPEIVKEPSFDEQEEYYNRNKNNLFSEQVQSNPDDPNSPMITRIMPFSEVSDLISEQLLRDKVNTKATGIIQEARVLADAALEDFNDSELMQLSIKERAEIVGEYENVAKELSTKYKVKVYSGLTGELSASEINNDEILSTLYMQGYVNNLGLSQIVFAVDELGLSKLGSYEIINPRMYMSIGPVRDISEKIMAIVRVVKSIKASEPESIDLTYSTCTFKIDPNQEGTDEDVFSVREKVVEDLKQLAAMDTAKSKAEELLELISTEDQDWDSAIDTFNKQYGQAEQDPNDPNLTDTELAQEQTLALENLTSLRRLSRATLDTFTIQSIGDPAAEKYKNERIKGALFIDQLFSLAPQDSNDTDFEPVIMEFKPDLSYYLIKNITVSPIWLENYQIMKGMRAYQESHIESQSMALSHYNPENILKRMNLVFVDEPQDDTEPNEPEAAL